MSSLRHGTRRPALLAGVHLALLATSAIASRAYAQPTTMPDKPPATTSEPRPRSADSNVEKGIVTRLRVDGELQLRLRGQSAFALPAGPTNQNVFGSGWLRLGIHYELGKYVTVVAQEDFASDALVGNLARGVIAQHTPRSARFSLRPRAAYVQASLPEIVLKVGIVPIRWGEGMIWNDGAVRSIFGDYRRGDIAFRTLVESQPLGTSRVVLGYAQDLVTEDSESRIGYGDHAIAGNLYALADVPELGSLGALVNYRTATNGRSALFPNGDKLDRLTLDLTGSLERIAAPIDGYVHAGFEAAGAFGNVVSRTAGGSRGQSQTIRSYGFLVRADVSAFAFGSSEPPLPDRYPCDIACRTALEHKGRLQLGVELGYASGDGSPENGTYSRFVFDHNHRVGLLLFDEVMRSMTARRATLIADNGRGPNAPDYFPSQGGVDGAMYLYPTLVYRPTRAIDVRFGVVKAQSSAALPVPRGAIASRDLGTELDLGFEGRIPLAFGTHANLGVEGAVLFPGAGLDNANATSGSALGTLWLGQARLGYTF